MTYELFYALRTNWSDFYTDLLEQTTNAFAFNQEISRGRRYVY